MNYLVRRRLYDDENDKSFAYPVSICLVQQIAVRVCDLLSNNDGAACTYEVVELCTDKIVYEKATSSFLKRPV